MQLRAFFTTHETLDWELAFTHTIHAHASHLNGGMDEYARSFAEAERAIKGIADDEDRAVVLQTFNLVPKPELTFYCHCRDCQRTTGNPFSMEVMIASEGFGLKGDLASYVVTGDSGKPVNRWNCKRGMQLIHFIQQCRLGS